MRYRAEIDGLRAVAVIPVMLFHAGLERFSGGYVGVDVFFVISGYLITSIIAADLADGNFSITRFYERRARRILPALYMVMLCCVPAALVWMRPVQLEDFLQSIGAVAVFGSNILFWLESDYFAAAAETKPLLHTWSLAVEEQFYVVYPLMLTGLWMLGRSRLVGMIAVLAAISLALSEWLRPVDAMANFYLAPTRAWELALGALLAVRAPTALAAPAWLAQAASALGLGLITYAVFAFDRHSLFPGLLAMIPAVGTLLVIAYATPGTVAGRMLSMKWLVGVGLISYSAYLWHQPLFAFARIRDAGEPTTMMYLALTALAVGLAWLSWRFVERPFRDRARIGARAVWLTSAGGFLLFGAVFMAGQLADVGRLWALRLEPVERERFAIIDQAVNLDNNRMIDTGCTFWSGRVTTQFEGRFLDCSGRYGQAILVTGDSHAMDLYNALALASEHPFLVSVAAGYCRPHVPVLIQPMGPCHYRDLASFLDRHAQHIGLVVFTETPDGLFPGRMDRMAIEDISATAVDQMMGYLSGLRSSSGVPVLVMGPQPNLDSDPRELDVARDLPAQLDEFRDINAELTRQVDKFLRAAAERNALGFVSRIDATEIVLPRDLLIEGKITYSDPRHLSRAGEAYFGALYVRELARLGYRDFEPVAAR